MFAGATRDDAAVGGVYRQAGTLCCGFLLSSQDTRKTGCRVCREEFVDVCFCVRPKGGDALCARGEEYHTEQGEYGSTAVDNYVTLALATNTRNHLLLLLCGRDVGVNTAIPR